MESHHHLGCCEQPHPANAARMRLDGVRVAERRARPHRRCTATKAELVVLGSVVTMDPSRPSAEAIAISDGRIIGVGSRSDLEGLIGPRTSILSHGTGAILPGFVEPHLHLMSSALIFDGIDCSPKTHDRVEDILDALRAGLAGAHGSTGVLGQGYDPSRMRGRTELTAELLDTVSTEVPVVVVNASQHYFYVNNAAYKAAGITAETPNPPGGDYGARDGVLTGAVAETAAMSAFFSVLPPITPDVLSTAITSIASIAAAAGVTSVHEAATGAVAGPPEVDLLHQVFGQSDFPIRGTLALWGLRLNDFVAAGLAHGSGDDRLRAQHIKWVSDGSNQGYTGYQRAAYLDRATDGLPNFTPEELTAHFAATQDAGWPIMCHANGEAAVDMVIGAFEQVAARSSWDATKRHRIEHASLLDDSHLTTMARLGITPSFLMNHVRLWGKVLRDDILGPERADRLDRYASTVAAGLRASMHSDYSVSPIGPLSYVATAAARTMADGGEVLNPAERVPVAEALRGVTIDAAWMCHNDDLVGSIETGKAADLVLLDGDPLDHVADPDAIREIGVLATYLDGVEVRSA